MKPWWMNWHQTMHGSPKWKNRGNELISYISRGFFSRKWFCFLAVDHVKLSPVSGKKESSGSLACTRSSSLSLSLSLSFPPPPPPPFFYPPALSPKDCALRKGSWVPPFRGCTIRLHPQKRLCNLKKDYGSLLRLHIDCTHRTKSGFLALRLCI